MVATLRRYFIAGLLVWIPLGITVLIVKLLVDFMDRTLVLVPAAWRPENVVGFSIPGLGFVLSLVLVILTGMIAANLIGRRIVVGWESLLARIPLVRTIYSAAKQVVESVLSTDGGAFRTVLLVEYPRKGIWTVAFQAGEGSDEIQQRTEKEMVTVFVPTTPNPTSGYIIMVPQDEAIVLDMSVEEGMKMVMSLGVVMPQPPAAKVAPVKASP